MADNVPSYPKYPTNSFETNNSVKMHSNALETSPTQIESSPISIRASDSIDVNASGPDVAIASSGLTENIAVSIFSLSYIEYLGMIGICVFVIFIATDLQTELEEQRKAYIIKSNVKPPMFSEMLENIKTNFINNIYSFFNNSIEYMLSKYQEFVYKYNKWRVNSHVENKILKTVDISYYKEKNK